MLTLDHISATFKYSMNTSLLAQRKVLGDTTGIENLTIEVTTIWRESPEDETELSTSGYIQLNVKQSYLLNFATLKLLLLGSYVAIRVCVDLDLAKPLICYS